MVRIFTTSFLFNHQHYDAIVTLVARQQKVNITVKVMDIALQELLPGGVLSFDNDTDLANCQHADNSLTQSLKKSISVAVERHLVA